MRKAEECVGGFHAAIYNIWRNTLPMMVPKMVPFAGSRCSIAVGTHDEVPAAYFLNFAQIR